MYMHTEIDGVREFINELPVLHLVLVVEGVEHLNSCTVQVPPAIVGLHSVNERLLLSLILLGLSRAINTVFNLFM